jgi:hypothetical protein
MKNQKLHKKGKQREVGREEGRRNENLPPSQIWRWWLGFQEKRREERGFQSAQKGRTKNYLLQSIYRDSLLQFSLCFHTFIALLIKK